MANKKRASRVRRKTKEITYIDHPLALYKSSILFNEDLSTSKYYSLAKELGMFLCFYMTKNLKLTTKSDEKPKKPAIVAMLRSGLVLADGFREINPSIRIGHIGIFKNTETGVAEVYLVSLPDLKKREVMLLDMSITTGTTAIEAISIVKEHQKTCGESRPISYGCVSARTAGLKNIQETYPDVSLFLITKESKKDHGEFGYFSKKIFGLD